MARKPKKPEHSSIGGSSAARWIMCPGSKKECEGLPNESNEYADEGTAAHDLGEVGLKAKRLVTMADKKKVRKKYRKYVNEDMIDYVNMYIQTVLDVFNEDPENELHVEAEVDLSHLYPGMFGKLDAVVVEPFGTIHVFDLKYGMAAVKAERNEQGMFYAVGAIAKFFEAIIEEVSITFVQPRVFDYPSTWVLPIGDLEDWRDYVLVPAAKATDDANAPLVAGDHCKKYYCLAFMQTTCPMFKAKVDETIGADVATVKPSELTLPDPSGMGSKEISNILNVSETIKAWLKNVNNMAKDRLLAGVPVEGRKLVEGKKGNRKWIDEAAVVEELSAIEGVVAVDLYEPAKLKSPAKIEKVKAVKTAGGKKLVDKLVSRTPGAPKMVADTDPKPAIELTVERFDEEDEYENIINPETEDIE